jgi:uroporphyrinogen decarboxylase
MTTRHRYIETLTFGTPDRIPFHPGGPRESTLRRWRTEGMPADANWQTYLCETIGIEPARTGPHVDIGADFRMIPQFEEKVIEHRDGHYVVQDWKGNICEISDEFDVTYLRVARDFVTRRWIRCPVENRDDWEQMKLRYDLDAPGRFPADFADRCRRAAGRDWVLGVTFSGPFWQMREWCGFEGLCMMMIDQPDLVADMAAFWTEFVAKMLQRVCKHVVPDSIGINEDMAYKIKAMISPAMTREFCAPSWTRWSKLAKAAGCPLVDLDSDGFVGELIPIWIDCGINVSDPYEVAAGNDIVDYRRQYGRAMAFKGGVDKRAMAKGGLVIREELKRIEAVVRGGGYIPGCDHGVPKDVSWPDFVDYAGLLARMTGWK